MIPKAPKMKPGIKVRNTENTKPILKLRTAKRSDSAGHRLRIPSSATQPKVKQRFAAIPYARIPKTRKIGGSGSSPPARHRYLVEATSTATIMQEKIPAAPTSKLYKTLRDSHQAIT